MSQLKRNKVLLHLAESKQGRISENFMHEQAILSFTKSYDGNTCMILE